MIRIWNMTNVDWMGYKLCKNDIFTYHHCLVKREHGGPMTIENGAILCGKSSHPYLHLIECKDFDRFCYITSLLMDENIMRRLDLKTIKEIDMVLKGFEREYEGKTNKKGKLLIKEPYLIRDYRSLEQEM